VAYREIADVLTDHGRARVYEEGWQSWSPVGVYPVSATPPRPPDARTQTMGWRPGKPPPEQGFQGEGLLAVDAPGECVRLWYGPEPAREVPSIRARVVGDRIVVSADAEVSEIDAASLSHALARVGALLGPKTIRTIPPGWCSWYCYFGGVTQADIVENVEAAERLSLPLEVLQIDDGYEAEIGDWLDCSPRFGSLEEACAGVLAAGKRPGVWTAPFLVGSRSRLARDHPDWQVEGADAGANWGQQLRVLDVTHPDAAEHLEGVYRTLAELGVGYHKLDFLYAGAIDGGRAQGVSSVEAYREGLRVIRRGAGPDAVLVGSGAPLLPSLGLVDAMRVGPDILAEPVDAATTEDPASSIAKALTVVRARGWMQGRLWVNDPDCLIARPEVRDRDRWAAQVERYGGLVVSSDRLGTLDAHGIELTRRALRPSSPQPRDDWDPGERVHERGLWWRCCARPDLG